MFIEKLLQWKWINHINDAKTQQLKHRNLNMTTTWTLHLTRKKLSNSFWLIPILFSFTGAKWSPAKTQSTNLDGGDNKHKRGSKGWLTAAMIWLHALQCTQGHECNRVQQVPTGPTPPPTPRPAGTESQQQPEATGCQSQCNHVIQEGEHYRTDGEECDQVSRNVVTRRQNTCKE